MEDEVKRAPTAKIPFYIPDEDALSASYLQGCLDLLGISVKGLSREDITFVACHVRTSLELSVGAPEYFCDMPIYDDEVAQVTRRLLKIRECVARALRGDL